jgi:hypothetical protein
MNIVSHSLFLLTCELPSKIFTSQDVIIQNHEPLLMTFGSPVVRLHRSELPLETFVSFFTLLLVSEPPRALFLLPTLYVHHVGIDFVGRHQTLGVWRRMFYLSYTSL